MSLILFIIYVLVVAILFVAAFLVFGSLRSKGLLARALHMSLFLVTMPRQSAGPGDGQAKPDKELIAVMEQLYAAFSNIHASGWNKFVYGEPYVALEMAVHHIGEEIHFYVAVPKGFEQMFEEQLHGLYPKANVERTKDYNVFNPLGASAATYLKLKADPILPIKTYARLESDPLGGIANALSKLEKEGEGAAIQILMRPSHREDIRRLAQGVAREMQAGNDFNKALTLARKGSEKKDAAQTNIAEPPKAVSAFEDDIIKALQAKASRPLFDVNVRMVASAPEAALAQRLLNDISAAFVQFSGPNLNALEAIKLSGRALEDLLFNYSFRIFDNSQTIHLSSEDLASIYHFPIQTTQAPRIKYVKSVSAEPPPNLPEEGVAVGINKFRGQERVVRMTDVDRRRHTYIIGQTGTGKSSLLKRMIMQDIERGKGVCVIDPHGELAEYALSVVPRERAEDVIYFNPGDVEYPLGLNMLEFDPRKPEQKTFIANELLVILKALYPDLPEAFGPMFEQYFKNSILLLLDVYEKKAQERGYDTGGIADQAPTIAEIPRVLTDEAYRRAKLADETNPLVKNFWTQEAEKAGGEGSLANMAPYINSKLVGFLSNDYLRPIIAQPKSAFNFREALDKSNILIVNLSKGRIGDVNAYLLGMIIVGKLLMAALSRVDVADEEQRPDFYLYMDEFQSFTTSSIATILSEARKYRLDLIMAHQFVKQLQDEIKNAVFGNVGSMIAFRIGADDAEFLKNQFEPVFTVQDLINVDNFNAHARLLINNQTTRPFTVQTVQESAGRPKVADAIKAISRLKYGRPKAAVESEIQNRYQFAAPGI